MAHGRPAPTSPRGDVDGAALVAVVAGTIVVAALALYGAWASWPGMTQPGGETPPGRTFALVLFAALLGALPHVLWSLSVSIGKRDVRRHAVLGYVLSPALGIGLAGLLALAVHIGILSAQRASPYGLAALAAITGFVADPAGRALLRAVGLKLEAT